MDLDIIYRAIMSDYLMLVSQFSAAVDISGGEDTVAGGLLDILPNNDFSIDSARHQSSQLLASG